MTSTADRRSASVNGGGSTERERFDAMHGFDDDRSIGQVVGDLVDHTQQLIRGELAFAKREMADSARQVGGAAAIGGAAVPFAFAAIVLLGFTIAFALAEAMPTWAAFLVATALFIVIAAALALVAKDRVKDAHLAPTHTIESAKEDLTWIKQHRN